MENLDENNLPLYKSLSNFVINGLTKAYEKVNSNSEKLIGDFYKKRNKFFSSETYDELGENNNQLNYLQDDLLKIVAIQDKIEKMLNRNQKRILFLQEQLDKIGIYNDVVDKKTMQTAILQEKNNVNENALNLNQNSQGDSVIYKFVEGEILAFINEKLDFSLEYNQNVLMNSSPDFIHKIVTLFPYSIATIPDELLMIPTLKNSILKECVLFVASNFKDKSIEECNFELGQLLANSAYLEDIEQFAEELKNYFNVSAKQSILKNMPELSGEVEGKLNCNEHSEFLPSSKRVAVLANGMAGNVVKSEEDESEEVRKEKEQEMELVNQIENFLNELFEEEDKKQQDDEEFKEDKVEEENIKKVQEEKNKKQEQEEYQEQLESALKKHDGDNDWS